MFPMRNVFPKYFLENGLAIFPLSLWGTDWTIHKTHLSVIVSCLYERALHPFSHCKTLYEKCENPIYPSLRAKRGNPETKQNKSRWNVILVYNAVRNELLFCHFYISVIIFAKTIFARNARIQKKQENIFRHCERSAAIQKNKKINIKNPNT
jgi:hypothetical protein